MTTGQKMIMTILIHLDKKGCYMNILFIFEVTFIHEFNKAWRNLY